MPKKTCCRDYSIFLGWLCFAWFNTTSIHKQTITIRMCITSLFIEAGIKAAQVRLSYCRGKTAMTNLHLG